MHPVFLPMRFPASTINLAIKISILLGRCPNLSVEKKVFLLNIIQETIRFVHKNLLRNFEAKGSSYQ